MVNPALHGALDPLAPLISIADCLVLLFSEDLDLSIPGLPRWFNRVNGSGQVVPYNEAARAIL